MIKPDVNGWLEWQRKRSQKKGFKRPFIGGRIYAHFDLPVSPKNKPALHKLKTKLEDPKQLEKWNFFPFIKITRNLRRFRYPPTDSDDQGVKTPVVFSESATTRNQKEYTHLKTRPLMAAAHQDACVYSLYNFMLEGIFEQSLRDNMLGENVLAYRSLDGKNNVDFAHEVFKHISGSDQVTCLLIDISGFFDSINHQKLLAAIEEISPGMTTGWYGHALKNVTQYRYILEDDVYKMMKAQRKNYLIPIRGTKAKRLCKIEDYNKYLDNKQVIRQNKSGIGIPQGSPVSGLLANIYLNQFDITMKSTIENMHKGFYRRYSDDVLIVCPTLDAVKVYEQCKTSLGAIGLKLKGSKTESFEYKNGQLTNTISNIEPHVKPTRQRMQYLGLEWDGKQIILRPGTAIKRFRPKRPTQIKFWKYSLRTIDVISQKGIRKQNLRLRRTVKKKLEK